MAPVSAAEFAARFRSLDPDERLAFVADLWAARGWETAVDDDRVIATRDDREVTVAVLTPSWMGRPSVPDADVVVATQPDGDLAGVVQAAGADWLTTEDLLNRLLYGIDRERAESLFTTHFDRPLRAEATGPAGSPSASQAGASRVPWRLVVALVVLVAVGAAVAFPGGLPVGASDEPAGTAPVTPVNVGTANGTGAGVGSFPPGLSATGLENASRLAAAHNESLAGRGYHWRVDAAGPTLGPLMRGSSRWNYTVAVENGSRARITRIAVVPHPNGSRTVLRTDVFVSGDASYSRYTEGDRAWQYHHFQPGNAGTISLARQSANFVRWFLATNASSVHCTERGDGGGCESFRVVATGHPTAFQHEFARYRAVATVEPIGRVQSLHVEYAMPVGNGTLVVGQFEFALGRVGDVTVRRPNWLAAARNASTRTQSPPSDSRTATSVATTTSTTTPSSNASETAGSGE